MTNRRSERTFRWMAVAVAAASLIAASGRVLAQDGGTRARVVPLGDSLDESLLRGSRRAALDQWWNSAPRYDAGVGLTIVGGFPGSIRSDGADVWVSSITTGTVSRIRASDGKLLESWTGATNAGGVLVAMGRVFVTGLLRPGSLYMIDPSHPVGAVATVAPVGDVAVGIAFDGRRIWTANLGGMTANTGGTVSIVTPGPATPWQVTTVSAGFEQLAGILFDGKNIWVTDTSAGTLLKLDGDGAIEQTVPVGANPQNPAFDGKNIWVPNAGDDSLTVVRASDGAVLKTFSAENGDQNGLSEPLWAAFDGQRILVTNFNGGLSLFQATDLSTIDNPPTPGVLNPKGVCSDGVNFWVSFAGSGKVGRF